MKKKKKINAEMKKNKKVFMSRTTKRRMAKIQKMKIRIIYMKKKKKNIKTKIQLTNFNIPITSIKSKIKMKFKIMIYCFDQIMIIKNLTIKIITLTKLIF
jgi:hypothetical protein